MRRKASKSLRWIIAGLLFLAILINYLDRQVLSVVAPMLRADLHLSNTKYAYAINAFLIAYGIMYTIGGRIVDLLNTRRGLAWSLAIWSAASALHTLVRSVWDLCVYRFLLGASEPGGFTGSVKAIASWFPTRERGVAIGLVVGGTGLGAIVAPPVVVWLAIHFGWRMAFLLPSLLGMLWVPLWLAIYHEPEHHPFITSAEKEYIISGRIGEAQQSDTRTSGWVTLLSRKQPWSFIMARFFADPLGYFYWFWLPSYLVSAKKFSFEELGEWLWIPYLLQGIGQIAGGYFSGYLIRRGMTPVLARKIGITASLFLTPAALLALTTPQVSLVLFYVSISTFGMGWWGASYNSALMDAIPRPSVSSVSGLAGSGGVISSFVVTWLTGYAADRHAYPLVFWVNSVLMALSVAVLWLLLRKPMDAEAPPHHRLVLGVHSLGNS